MEAREQRVQNVREMVLAGVNPPVSQRSLDEIFAAAVKNASL